MEIKLFKPAEDRTRETLVFLCAGADGLEKLCPTAAKSAKAFKKESGELAVSQRFEDDKVLRRWFVYVEDANYDTVESALENIIVKAREEKLNALSLVLSLGFENLSEGIYKKLFLANNNFNNYKKMGLSAENKPVPQAEKIEISVLLHEGYDLDAENKKAGKNQAIASGISLARWLVNEPANVMTPVRLAEEAKKAGEKAGFDVKIYDEKQIQEMHLDAFYAVAKGSDNPPRFIVMEYKNNPDSDKLLALVGKGLCYDSGGYAIKPGPSMNTMFCDMGGAAAVVGAMYTIASLKLPVNVVSVVAACENMVSGHAYRNGDIISSHAGKFIEVVNTDAEGRLTLADAISYAASEINADAIIDIATLTGAALIALGDEITGLVSDDEELAEKLSEQSKKCGDKLWRLPHFESLAKLNKSERADIKNSGGRPAGTATAALFCRAFAHGKRWAHLDIAGTAYSEKGSSKAPYGATGVGSELLARTAKAFFEE
ncbi:MAG: leucyl aminopeptidase [Eubacteriales bacterium]|nr:leucyl aminopeptidase [Eubacteriales bacterium]